MELLCFLATNQGISQTFFPEDPLDSNGVRWQLRKIKNRVDEIEAALKRTLT